MKFFVSKLCVLIFSFYLISNLTTAQDNKLMMHAISIGPGIASLSSENSGIGPGFNFDLSTIVNKHIISLYSNAGFDLNDSDMKEQFIELNLTYGRKWSLSKSLIFEGHIGLGLFSYDLDEGPSLLNINLPDYAFGIPIRAKMIYLLTEKFGFGVNPNINFNSLENSYSANFILQYNFN